MMNMRYAVIERCGFHEYALGRFATKEQARAFARERQAMYRELQLDHGLLMIAPEMYFDMSAVDEEAGL